MTLLKGWKKDISIATHKIFIKNWLRNAEAKNKSCFNFY